MSDAAAAEDWPPPVQGWTTVAVLSLAYIVSFVDRTILALLVEPIKADLGISDTQVALLQGAAFGLFYTILGLPMGWAVDRYPRKWVIGFGCTLWCLMTAACGFAARFAELFLARMGVGVGEAALSPGAASMIADLFPPERRPLAMSVYAMGGSIGVGLSLLVGGAVIDFVGAATRTTLPLIGAVATWQAVLIIVGLAGLVVAFATLLLPEPQRRGRGADAPTGVRDGVAFLLTQKRRFGLLFGAIALYGLVAYAVLGWVPTLFIRVHGWTAGEVGLRYGLVFMIFGGLGAVLGGWVASQLARRKVPNYDIVTAAIGVTLFVPFGVTAPLVGNPWLALALFAPVALCFALPTGSVIAAIQRVTPNRLRGQVSAIYYLVIGLVGLLLGPLAVALLNDRVFTAPDAIGLSLALVAGTVTPVAALLLWLARQVWDDR